MKKLIAIFGLITMFTTFANAATEASCQVPNTDAYVTAYVSGGTVYASNLSDKKVTVTVRCCNGSYTVNLDAWETGKEVCANCTNIQSVSNPICK